MAFRCSGVRVNSASNRLCNVDPPRASVRVWLRETSTRGTYIRYVYWFRVLAGSVSTDQQEKERRQTGPKAEHIMTNSIRLPVTYNAACAYASRGIDHHVT